MEAGKEAAMKLCLCFHCLCESYDDLTGEAQELFVSLADMRDMIEQLLASGYTFSNVEDAADNTIAITFDDGYANNLLFNDLAQEYNIPFVVFVSAYYIQTGEGFPWLKSDGQSYGQMHQFDYYAHHQERGGSQRTTPDTSPQRPLTFEELSALTGSGLAEIGCHGYYHQPLSKGFEKYLQQEQSVAMSILGDRLGVKPRYFALANGMYTGQVVRQLLKTFTRVFTIDGMAYRPTDNVIHRLSLTNPNISSPLSEQIAKGMRFARQVKRAIRVKRRLFA